MKKLELSLLAGMIITIFITGICSFAEEYKGITENVFRLHILANSDTEEDQELKIKVRDEVLEKTAYLFKNNSSVIESAKIARNHLNEIQTIAEDVISENGYDYTVNCEVTDMYFTKRIYDTITMPEGIYTSLRITIGEAKGKNWWCVMFPPLCLPAVTNIDDVLAGYNGIFTAEEIEMLQQPDKYEIKFYFLELYYKIKEKLK